MSRPPALVPLARALRLRQTSAEARLWTRLRNRGLNGYKFVRQEPVGGFILDFLCRTQKLAVEIDGATHSTQTEIHRDMQRTSALEALGYRVIRFTNAEISSNLSGVLETILSRLENRDTL